MGRNRFDYTHGDTGKKPASALDFESNGRPDSQHFDWLWYTIVQNVNAHADEFDRLDSDDDGTVDEADYSLDSDKLDGNHWSDVKSWVNDNTADDPHGDSAHTEDYLKDATQFADANHTHSQLHDRYTDSEARNAVKGVVDISDLDGSKGTADDVVVTDGSNLYYTDISNTGSDYTDADAVDAIETENTLSIDITGDADTLDGNHASTFADSNHSHSQLHDRYTDSEAVNAVETTRLDGLSTSGSGSGGHVDLFDGTLLRMYDIGGESTSSNAFKLFHSGSALIINYDGVGTLFDIDETGDVRIEGSLSENQSL
jgi:hypothetical protein